MTTTDLTTLPQHALTAQKFQGPANVPPEAEWFANIRNGRTRRAYRTDLQDFMDFAGIIQPEEFRQATRAHLIAWRKVLESRKLAPATVRRKLAALSSIFDHLCERNAVTHNPVKGVERPKANNNEGMTPGLDNHQALLLPEAPDTDSLKGKRERAMLSTLLYHGIRRQELCDLPVKDVARREGVLHLRINGKGGKIRHVPVAPVAGRLISDYRDAAGHGDNLDGPLCRPVKNNYSGDLISPFILRQSEISSSGMPIRLGSLSIPTAFVFIRCALLVQPNALECGAEISRVQEWSGHSNISTTRLCDKRKSKREDSPSVRVKY